jgi:hypothetical protein
MVGARRRARLRHAPPGTRGRALAGAILLLIILPGTSRAQTPTDSLAPAGAEYQFRGTFAGVERLLYGRRYRSRWATPVAAPRLPSALADSVVDPASLLAQRWYWTPDDSLWEFRPLNRDLVAAAPPALRQNFLPSVIQGFNAARHPGAAPVVAALAVAVGVEVPSARLMRVEVLTGSLGDRWRLGYLAQAGPGGPTTTEILDRLRRDGGAEFDGRAYLRERLFDTYLGSWDEAPDRWQWARTGANARWAPLPRGRDRAFAIYDGLLAGLGPQSAPELVAFGNAYNRGLGLTPLQRALDRQLLSQLDWATWDSTATSMREALSDSVITAAVARLAPAYALLDSARLGSALRARRDALPSAARRLYRLVNQEAALFGTPGADTVTITQWRTDSVEVAFKDGFSRHFGPEDVDAIALYLGGGADHVELRGEDRYGPRVDIAWQPGLTLAGPPGSGSHTTLFGGGETPRGLRVHVLEETLPPPETADLDPFRAKPLPLQGTSYTPALWVDVNSDVGVLLGGGVNITSYRLGHQPYYRWLQVKGGYATAPGEYAIEFHGRFNRWRSRSAATLDAGLSQIAVLHFYGYGNTTPSDQPDSYYRAQQTQLYLYPAWNFRSRATTRVTLGPVYKYVATDTTADNLLNSTQPYGVPEFAQLGVQGSAVFDTRDATRFARHGYWITAGGSFYPFVFGAGTPFGGLRVSAAAYLTPRDRSSVTLAVRGTMRVAVGDVPVHEASYAGGSNSLRGYPAGRYAGNVAVYFNNELRVRVGTLPFFVPWRLGVVGIADVGRVFDPPSANIWHGSFGGGVWIAMPDRSMGGVVTAVHSPEGTSIWLGTGFMF